MINELVKLGENVPLKKRTTLADGSMRKEPVAMCLDIDNKGNFQEFIPYGKEVYAEVITDTKGLIKAKQGSARFLLDKCEEVLGVSIQKTEFESFWKMLEPFKKLEALAPIFKFYEKRQLRKAIEAYLCLGNDNKEEGITFTVGTSRMLGNAEVIEAVKGHIEKENKKQTKKTNKKKYEYKETTFATEIVINKDGEFIEIKTGEKQSVLTEVISEKKKENSLLIGRPKDVFGIIDVRDEKKHQQFLAKLEEYRTALPEIEPVFKFYEDENNNGLKKAISESVYSFGKDCNQSTYNITFSVEAHLLLNEKIIKGVISNRFKEKEKKLSENQTISCSVCGKPESPILSETHGAVSMPNGQKAGCALVSYNDDVFMSYGLKGNLNSSICRNCARKYMEGLNYLLTDGHQVPEKEKQKAHFEYYHRIDISDSTVVLFWASDEFKEFDPSVINNSSDVSKVQRLLESPWNGKKTSGSTIDKNMFYCATLSSAAARIAVRDWTAISLDSYKQNIIEWFKDIAIEGDEGETIYSPLWKIVNATQKDPKPGEKAVVDKNSKTKIGSFLWNAAIKGCYNVSEDVTKLGLEQVESDIKKLKIPIEVLLSVLNRIWKGDKFTIARAAIIKLIINRNTGNSMKPTLDESNTSVAYLCGRLFAVIESMQWMAICNGRKDKKVNNGVKERFFVAAAYQPAYIFGMLLTKNVPIYQHKIGGYLAKELNEIAGRISEVGSFPQRFSTIEQGEFALGYYFQRNHKNE